MAKRKSKRRSKKTETATGVDAAVAETTEASAGMSAMIGEDETRPDQDVSANIAAMDQFEAAKSGKANDPPSVTAWDVVEAAVLDAVMKVGGTAEIKEGCITIIGDTKKEAKLTAAHVWRALGELRRQRVIQSLPQVDTKVIKSPPPE